MMVSHRLTQLMIEFFEVLFISIIGVLFGIRRIAICWFSFEYCRLILIEFEDHIVSNVTSSLC